MLLLLVLVGAISCINSTQDIEIKQKPVISTYYLIRHAEKDTTDKENRNPELLEAGLARADNWAEVFKHVSLNHIYSTDYFRTKMTAAPTAKAQNVNTEIFDYRNFDYEAFKKTHENKSVLIVGHSNTTPIMANGLLGEEKYEQMDEHDNGSLFIIKLVDSVATAVRLQIN